MNKTVEFMPFTPEAPMTHDLNAAPELTGLANAAEKFATDGLVRAITAGNEGNVHGGDDKGNGGSGGNFSGSKGNGGSSGN